MLIIANIRFAVNYNVCVHRCVVFVLFILYTLTLGRYTADIHFLIYKLSPGLRLNVVIDVLMFRARIVVSICVYVGWYDNY